MTDMTRIEAIAKLTTYVDDSVLKRVAAGENWWDLAQDMADICLAIGITAEELMEARASLKS